MAATPRNPPPAAGTTPSVAEFPGAPSAGQTAYHTGFGATFVYTGTRWRSQDGGAGVYPAGAGVVFGKPVLLVAGTLALLDIDVHDAATGICASDVVDGDIMVRWLGEIDGLVGLTRDAIYYGSDTAGALTTTPDNGKDLLRLARAASTTRLNVSVELPVLA